MRKRSSSRSQIHFLITESQVLKALANRGTPERAVVAVAHHPKWSSQYNVRMALVRNAHTPAAAVLTFLPQLTLRDFEGRCETR